MQKPDRAEQEMFLGLIARGRSVATAAGELGFTAGSFQTLARTDDVFADELRSAAERATGKLEDTLYDKAADGSQRALEMWLKAMNPEKWGDKASVSHTISGPGGGPVQVAAVSVNILREVLTDPETRNGALRMVSDLPAIDTTATET